LTLSVAPSLEDLGWDAGWEAAFEPHRAAGLRPGRVTIQHRGAYVLGTAHGDVWAELPRRLVRLAETEASLPAVGDWVAWQEPAAGGRALVDAVLERRSSFSRKTPWLEVREQVMAANVDIVLLVQALPDDFNVRRLERYLATAWESGAVPAIVLTKIDLVDDPSPFAAQVEEVAFGVPVHLVSNVTGDGLDELRAEIQPGRTVALLGSSGIGKSTIVNRLAGEEVLETQAVRRDGKGRHTTSHRELVLLPGGGVVLDTPGMRELQLWSVDEGLERAFEDIDQIASACRFRDCAHEQEPGCAIREALATGALESERWDSYRKLQREVQALHERLDARARKERVRRFKIHNKAARKLDQS
jgi:ribosome biogenesis GTPase / thiamine phosphate phosphatase